MADIVSRLASRAVTGRGWEPQPLSNGYLKGKGGPGVCVKHIVERMVQAGLIEFKKGFYNKANGAGRLSRMRASEKLRAIMASCGVPLFGGTQPITTTMLRGGTGVMPDRIREQDATIKAFNQISADRRLGWADGTSAHEVYLVRLFKGEWTMGGRLFGGFWQNMREDERADLRIDGEPVVELDFVCMQPRLLFAKVGLELDFDPYVVPGFDVDRKAGKLAYNKLANRDGGAVRSCPINFTAQFKPFFQDRSEFAGFVGKMQERLEPISHFFGKDSWGMLQHEESDIMINILQSLMDKNIPAYPIHDSIIVKSTHADTVEATMISAFRSKYGVSCIIRRSQKIP